MSSAKNRCLSFLFALYARDVLEQMVYDAILMGFSYTMSVTTYGIKLSVDGYSSKIDVFLQKLVEELVTINVEENRFGVIKAYVNERFIFLVP
jgi:secreted Zn-dependent insulinase-like peptidase